MQHAALESIPHKRRFRRDFDIGVGRCKASGKIGKA
jgi:hypothetical protein